MRGGPQGSAATAHTLGALYTGAAPSIRLISCQVKCASGSPGQRPCPDDALGNGHTVTQQLPTIVTFHLLPCRAATLSGQERTSGCSVPSSPGACPEQDKGRGVRKQHSHSSPESPRPAAASTDPGMKTLLLTLGLSLLAALRAQTLPVGDEENQDVRLRWAEGCGGREGQDGWVQTPSLPHEGDPRIDTRPRTPAPRRHHTAQGGLGQMGLQRAGGSRGHICPGSQRLGPG